MSIVKLVSQGRVILSKLNLLISFMTFYIFVPQFYISIDDEEVKMHHIIQIHSQRFTKKLDKSSNELISLVYNNNVSRYTVENSKVSQQKINIF